MYPQLTAARLAEAITDTLAQPDLRLAAARLAEQLRGEQGVLTARVLIERFMAQRAARQPLGVADEVEAA